MRFLKAASFLVAVATSRPQHVAQLSEHPLPVTRNLNIHVSETPFCVDRADGYYQNPQDCSEFYICSNGVTYEGVCPPGTVFDPTIVACNWPQYVDCEARPTDPTPEPTTESSTTTSTASPTEPPTTTTTTTAQPTTKSTTSTSSAQDNCQNQFQRNVIYIDWKVNWSDINSDIRAAIDACFNVINLSFWMYNSGFVDAALVFAQQDLSAQQDILEYAHSRGAKIMISAGGATEHIESFIADNMGSEYGRAAAQAAASLNLDGVDFDLELTPGNNEPFLDGSFQQFILDCNNAARQVLGSGGLISHAPQAPYLGEWAGASLGYTGLIAQQNLDIDFMNIQFYNQGAGLYTTYDNLMVETSGWVAETAVNEIINNGVPADKVVIGKPIGSSGFANNGYVAPSQLNQFACEYKAEYLQTIGGFMTWMYPGPGSPLLEEFGFVVNSSC